MAFALCKLGGTSDGAAEIGLPSGLQDASGKGRTSNVSSMKYFSVLYARVRALIAAGGDTHAKSRLDRDALEWNAAREAGTIGAYQRYLDLYPVGGHAGEAFRAIIKLSIEALPRQPDVRERPGVKQDLVEAVRWYARAAGSDDVPDARALVGAAALMSAEAKQHAAAAMLRQATGSRQRTGDLADAIARFQQAPELPANGELSGDLLIALAERA